jgi:thioredoxin reductase
MKEAKSPSLDVLIVGGGPAGLAAALVLGRSLRRVLLCDAGHPRNESSEMLNGYLSRDGIAPKEFLEISRSELKRYETVAVRHVAVTDIGRNGELFVARLASGEQVTTRLVLLAYGLVDILPNVEGIRQMYGKAVHSCPYCHGWECRGQPIAVLGGDAEATELAIELLQWSSDVVLCANGRLQCGRKLRNQLKEHGVQVLEGAIESLRGEGSILEGICFVDGKFLPRTGCFLVPAQQQHSTLGEHLGCKFGKNGCILCSKDGLTSVPGIYAAGNARLGTQLVIATVAEGTVAGVAMNERLLKTLPKAKP